MSASISHARPVVVVAVVVVAALSSLALGGCNDFSVPKGVQIRCSTTADCPDNFKCNGPTGLCVPVDRADLQGPVVVSATADATDVGVDASGAPRALVIKVVLDEDLVVAASSLVLVDAHGDRPFAAWTADATVPHGFTATYATSGDETQGVPLQLRAALEDALGNRSTTVLPIAVRFDFVAPSLLADPAPLLQVLASVDNPLALDVDTVTQTANAAADVQLSFVASEALAADRVTVTAVGASGVAFTLVAATGAAVQMSASVATDASDGTFPLQAELVDLAGNAATVDLGVSLHVDVNAPAAPDVVTAGAITLERAPWGRIDGAGASPSTFALDDFRVVGTAGAVEPSSTVIVYRDDAGTREIGRMPADTTGAFGGAGSTAPLLLDTGDLRAVTVRTADRAGNLSAAVQVKETAWFATMAGRAVGDDVSNPHRFESAPIFAAGRAWDDLAELTDVDGVGAPDAQLATTQGAGTWERVPTDAVDLSRAVDAAVGHDPLRGQTVIFGGAGQQNSGNFHDGGTNACGGGLNLLFLRERGGPWRSLAVDPVNGPPGMRGAHMAFDSDRERLVLVGQSGGGFQQWEWDGTTFVRACTAASCSASAPVLASSFGLTMDPVRHALVLLQTGVAGTETWRFDGARWQQACAQSPCSDDVPALVDPVLGYSEGFGEVLAVGAGSSSEEVWTFDGTRWLERCTDAACLATRPPPRASSAAAIDRTRDEVVLFGGTDPTRACSFNSLIPFFQTGDPNNVPNPPLADTWTFDGTVWTQALPQNVPPARNHASAVWEETEGRILMLGGDDCECAVDIGSPPGITAGVWQDTLAWDGADWSTAVAPAPAGFVAATPVKTAHHAATHDAASGRVVLAGGGLDRIFVIDHDRLWRGVDPIDPDLARFGVELATFTVAGQVVNAPPPILFSGTPVQGQALELDVTIPPRTALVAGESAFDICNAGPCAANQPTPSAFGGSAGDGSRVLVFGGMRQGGVLDFNTSASQHIGNELWAFDGGSGTWSQLCTTSPCSDVIPAARMGAQLTTLPDGTVLLFGGANSGNEGPTLGDTWIFDGQTWTEVTPADSPPARVYAAQALDAARGAVVLTAGLDIFGRASTSAVTTRAIPPALDEVWEFSGGLWRRAPEFDLERDGRPSSRFASATAWDNTRAGVVVHGGVPSPVDPIGGVQTDLSVALDDAWRWRGGADGRPAQRFRPSLAAAGFTSDQILDVTIVWLATGSSFTAGAPDAGLSLFAWDGLSWRALTTTSCGAGCVQWSSADDLSAFELPRLFTGTAGRGSFVLTTRGVNGAAPSYADVATDAVELRVHARRP